MLVLPTNGAALPALPIMQKNDIDAFLLLPCLPLEILQRVLLNGGTKGPRCGARIFRQYVIFREAVFVTFWTPIREYGKIGEFAKVANSGICSGEFSQTK